MTGFAIRAARLEDAPALAEVHVKSWHESYPGLVPQHMLDGLDIGDRTRRWQDRLRAPQTGMSTFLVEDGAGVAGFVTAGPMRQDGIPADIDLPPCDGEFHAVYILDRLKGSGAGQALMVAAARHLRALGHGTALVWVLTGNARARRFYEKLGARLAVDGVRPEPADSAGPNAAYRWDSLEELAAHE